MFYICLINYLNLDFQHHIHVKCTCNINKVFFNICIESFAVISIYRKSTQIQNPLFCISATTNRGTLINVYNRKRHAIELKIKYFVANTFCLIILFCNWGTKFNHQQLNRRFVFCFSFFFSYFTRKTD